MQISCSPWPRAAATCLLLLAACSSALRTRLQPEDLVEVLAGTSNEGRSEVSDGNTLPQIKMPWGMNDWVPQTSGDDGAFWFSRKESRFQGMRCTHQPSPWIGDYSHFNLQPHAENSPKDLVYSAEEAVFRPYQFRAVLSDAKRNDGGITFELAPTQRAAALRVTYPTGAKTQRLTLDIEDGRVWETAGRIEGYTEDREGEGSSGGPWKMYFVLQSEDAGVKAFIPAAFDGARATLEFSTIVGTAKVATSFVSLEQARLNLAREIGNQTFDVVTEQSQEEWHSRLSAINVNTADDASRRLFYTNLWKSMLFPRQLHEIDAEGREIHRSPHTNEVKPGKMVADSGFWDAYNSVYALQSIAFPDNFGDTVAGWVNAFDEAGWLPQWASPGQRACMVGTMADVTLADAIMKQQWGLAGGFDAQKAYAAIRKDAFEPGKGLFGRVGLRRYVSNGYISESDFPGESTSKGASESVSRTQNYWEADAAIARAASVLGYEEDARVLQARSMRYPELFNATSLFFQPKKYTGDFYTPYDPLAWGQGYTEAGGWQYRFNVRFDVPGLQGLFGGKLCESIEEMFTPKPTDPAYHPGSYMWGPTHEQKEATEVFSKGFGYYSHNNQPVHHVLWVAKKAGCDELADRYLRRTIDELYTISGWAGDEDNGEMASWYVLSALGIFQLEGALDELLLGSPSVVSASVRVAGGNVLRITTENQNKDNVYVQSITWIPEGGSERVVEQSRLKFTEAMRGGTLHFILGSAPVSKS